MRLQARTEPKRCAYCHERGATGLTACEGCGTTLHTGCLIEAGSCPTIGCGKLVEPMEKCCYCEGLGRVGINFDWDDCNRCGGTGYRKKQIEVKPKGPSILLTAMGLATARALEEEEKKLPWYGQRYGPGVGSDCHWCGLPEDHHAGTKDHCPINAAALLKTVQYERDQERMRRATEEFQSGAKVYSYHMVGTVIFCTIIMLLALSPCVLAAILGR